MIDRKTPIRGLLPMVLPRPCPICGSKVYLTGITEWGADDGEISGVDYDCESEPDIDSDDWPSWQGGHWKYPYIDWLPWEIQMMKWLNKNYRYDEREMTEGNRGTRFL